MFQLTNRYTVCCGLFLLAPVVAAGQSNPLALSPDGKLAVVQGVEPRTVQFVSVASGNVLRTLTWPSTLEVTRYALSPDGATLAVFTQGVMPVEKTVTKQVEQKKGWKKETVTVTEKVTEQVSCRQLKLLTVDTNAVAQTYSLEADLPKTDTTLLSLQYSADGTMLVGLDTANTIHLWDVATGKQTAVFTDLEGFTGVALSPDNAWLAAASPDHTIKRWEVKTQKALEPLEGHNRADVFLLAASADGKRLASADRDGHVLLWDTATWQPSITLILNPTDSGALTGLAFNPDGTVLATTQRMRTQPDAANAQQATYWRAAICLWCVRTGAPVTAISENEWFADYTQVAFNRAGNTLAALSWGFSGKEANAPWTARVACWRLNQELGTSSTSIPTETASSLVHALPGMGTAITTRPTTTTTTPAPPNPVTPVALTPQNLAQVVAQTKDGDTIHLPAGDYMLTEPLMLTKSLTLIGEGMEKVTIHSACENAVIRLEGEHAWTLEGITFKHDGPAWAFGAVVVGGKISIKHCAFLNAVEEKEHHYGGSGLVLIAKTIGTISNSRFTENAIGIQIGDNTQVLLQNNICEKNTQSGLLYYDKAKGEAQGNQCRENGYSGICIRDEATPHLQQNICEKNTVCGIAYFNKAGGEAQSNQCKNNGTHGISVQNDASPRLLQNVCEKNTYSGIANYDNAGGIVEGNTCIANILNGIYITGNATIQLKDNILKDNKAGDLQDDRIIGSLLQDAEVVYQNKDYVSSVEKYQQIITRFPDAPQIALIRYRFATAYYRLGGTGDKEGYQNAINNYQDFFTRYHENELADDALYWMGTAYSKLDDIKQAYLTYEKLVTTYPKGDMLHYAQKAIEALRKQYPDIVDKR